MARRAGGVECVDLNEISAEIQIPEQLEKLCTSPAVDNDLGQKSILDFSHSAISKETSVHTTRSGISENLKVDT